MTGCLFKLHRCLNERLFDDRIHCCHTYYLLIIIFCLSELLVLVPFNLPLNNKIIVFQSLLRVWL